MTTPTLEKAAAVLEKLERDGYRFLEDLSGHQDSTLIAYIAAAIREAEDAALERAAQEIEREATASQLGSHEATSFCGSIIKIVRSLKSKD